MNILDKYSIVFPKNPAAGNENTFDQNAFPHIVKSTGVATNYSEQVDEILYGSSE